MARRQNGNQSDVAKKTKGGKRERNKKEAGQGEQKNTKHVFNFSNALSTARFSRLVAPKTKMRGKKESKKKEKKKKERKKETANWLPGGRTKLTRKKN